MSNHLDSIEPKTSTNGTNADSNNSNGTKELNMSVDEIDRNENSGEMIKNDTEQVIPSNMNIQNLVLDNVGNELLNTTDHNINIVDDVIEHLNDDYEDDILQKTASVRKKKIMAIDDDSEDENSVLVPTPSITSDEETSKPIREGNKKKHRRLAIVDTDSDIDDEVVTPHNKSFTNEGFNSKEQVIFTTNLKGELVPETPDGDFAVRKSRLLTLCDPESSDEEVCNDGNAEEFNIDKEEIKPKPYKKKIKPKKDDEHPRKMTGKEAAELRKEIKSESQRMVREMNVSLPYHKPKSHTLKEFLARRSKFVSTGPFAARTPPSVAIKMSTEQLAVITEQLKRREKEVKEFYKSESESEDDHEDKDCIPPDENKEESQESNNHASNTKNIYPMVTVSEEIKDNGQDSGISLQEISNKLRDHSDEDSLTKNTKNIDPMETVSDEIKDNGQDSVINLHEISNKLRDHSDEDSLTKNTKNIDPMETVSDEIKDNGQDSGINLEEMSKKLKDHSDEDSLTKNTKNIAPMETVSDEIKDNGQDFEINLQESSNKLRDHSDEDSLTKNSKNIVPMETFSDEIKDNGQDSGLNLQEINNRLKDHSDEDSLTKLNCIEERSMVGEKSTNQVLEDVTVSDKSNVDIEALVSSEDHNNSLNSGDNLNNEEAEISKETEEINELERVAENNNPSEIPKPMENTKDSFTDYEFYLDDLEENSERLVDKYVSEGNDAEKPRTRFKYTDLDREIENFGLDSDDKTKESANIVPKLTKLEFIKEGLANFRPKLSGGPDHIIDLDSVVAKPDNVTRLMERFAQHNLKKHVPKNKVKLSIVNIESGKIHEETVAVNVKQEDDLLEVEEKPGVKMQRLRDELQNQIAQRRSEFWQKKNKKDAVVEEESIYEGEKEDCGMDDDILDDEEEEGEMTDVSADEEIDDEVEDDRHVEIKKSAFIDEEAEESDRDDDDNDIDADIECDSDLNEDENSKSSVVEKLEEQPVKKSLRRIIKGFADDSDDEDENISSISTTTSTSGSEIKNVVNINSQDNDYFLPPHQPQSNQTPVRQISQDKSELDFFPTPVSYITGLQNLNNSASKSLKDSPVMSLFHPTNVPSPLKENNWHESLQKKLFADSDITDSQLEGIAKLCSEKISDSQESNETNAADEEELVKICSGTFPSSPEAKGNETQLAELCSGAFPSTLEPEKQGVSPEECPSTQDLLNICSGKFTGVTQNESTEKPGTDFKRTAERYMFNTNKEMESLDADQDMIISQLIDEEEMEKFKKKFDSPLLSNTQRRIVEEFEEVLGSGGVIDSDDEDEGLEVKKRKRKRLMFSDDENSDEDGKEEEVIDLHDDVGSDYDEDAASDVAADNIGYDSEENEIELAEEKAGPKLKPSDFFENEAELSESEWGSADEDEKDLDTMEFEQGDTEKFDEKKIRADLEKIHMRRLLDDDTREVKMLQELLLEDGELHGTGRERQFKWKNINSVDDENGERKDEDDVYLDEEESEEQWRKRRYEREMFLKEKQEKVQYSAEDEDLLSESQLLKIGHKVLQRSQSGSQGSTSLDKIKVTPSSPEIKQPFSLLNKRGSFLSRSDHILQRLAEYNKVVTSVGQGSAKNSRKFLFQTVSVEETSVSINQDKKRKATDGTPKAIKKLRLSENFSPVVSKKNKDKSAKAKLFGNW